MRKKTCLLLVTLSLAASLLVAAGVKPKIAPKIEAFNYGEVKLLPGLFKERFDTNRNYLMSIPSQSLLYPFYKEAVIRVPAGTNPLGGWEAMSVDVRGHFMGHFLSACARIYATSGDTEIKAKAGEIVAELAKCQKANGNGYVGSISEKVLTALETGRESEVWAPYYVHHKTLMGFYEMYKYAGNQQALEVEKGFADYIKARMDKLSDERVARILEVEYGGMSEALYDLYGVTGEEKYRELAKRFEQARFLDPLAQGHDNLNGLHANTNIPKVYGAARAYELTGDTRYRDIAINFWDILRRGHTYATGGSNKRELWDRANQLSETLSDSNQETCTTYNSMWLTRYLIQWTGEAKYGDYYERNLYNGILGAQRPADGQFCYFTPMKSGSEKEFGTPLHSFWCCYGTGVQAFADLASSIYFHDAENLYVNLFAPSEVTWNRAGGVVRVTQETDYPQKSSTRLTIKAAGPGTFGLKVRVPWWAKQGVEVKINQAKIDVQTTPSSFMTIQRKWKDQDVVEISMPMRLSADPINDDPDLVAVMYGPMVMAGLVFDDTAFKGDKTDVASWLERAPGNDLVIGDRLPKTGDSLPDEISHPSYEAGLRRERIALTFETKSPNLPVKFIPLYQVTSQPYGIYFRVTE
jgi:DUF1680 family protein